jgi:hypothetical protein
MEDDPVTVILQLLRNRRVTNLHRERAATRVGDGRIIELPAAAH